MQGQIGGGETAQARNGVRGTIERDITAGRAGQRAGADRTGGFRNAAGAGKR